MLKINLFLAFTFAASLSGCSSIKYSQVRMGTLEGKATIEWVAADKFIYNPDPQNPLKFTRSNGDVIVPKRMYTDGGSIPRVLWAIRNYSPWAYGPAYLLHDWLFDTHHCKLPEGSNYTVDSAADVMTECIKTIIEKSGADVPKDKAVVMSIDFAVRTAIAKDLWQNGKCVQPPNEDSFKLMSKGVAEVESDVRTRFTQIIDFTGK